MVEYLNKSLSGLKDKLRELLSLYAEMNLDEFVTDVIKVHEEELSGLGTEAIWKYLANSWPDLGEAHTGDKDNIIGLLKAIHKKTRKKKKGEEEEKEQYKRKAHFEIDGRLYLEILTRNEEYQFAYLNDNGDVELREVIGDVAPVELLCTQDGELARIVKMPDEGITSCDLLAAGDLLHKITQHIAAYCDMDDLDMKLCSYYALFTWFYKKTNTTGYLRFLADTGKGKSRMHSVIGDLCFYPTAAGGSSSFSGMMRTHERWHGTLLIDEGDTGGNKDSPKIKYFNLGFEAGKYYILSDKRNPRYQEVFDPFGPKIISMREHFKDNATEGRLLSISPYETTKEDIPRLLDRAYEEKTRNLRNEIARFVLTHWNDVDGEQMISFKGVGIEPRLQQLAMPISIIFQLWGEGRGIFKSYIAGRQKQLKKDRALSWEGSMFNLVYTIANGDEELKGEFGLYYSQDDEIEAITPSMVAKLMNTSTRAATGALRSIGFDVERRWITLQGPIDEEKWKPKRKRVRTYVVPNRKTWREIIQRYYYSEDEENPSANIDIPVVLRSGKYVDTDISSVPTVLTVPKKQKNRSGTLGTDAGTPKGRNQESEKNPKVVNIDDINEDDSIRPGALDKKQDNKLGELKKVIKSSVIDATKEDDRGAMTVAMANRIANDFLYETAEVKAETDKMVHDGELLLSEDDYGKYVKVVCEDGCCEPKFIPSPNLDEDECSQCGDVLMCEWQIEEEGEWLPICQSCKLIIQERER